MKAVILYSGGLDSTTVVAVAHEQGFKPVLLSFDYGQQHDHYMPQHVRGNGSHLEKFEVKETVFIGLPHIGTETSSLVSYEHEVPKGKDPRAPGIPTTYVPARNSIFLAYAASVCEEIGARDIFIGVNNLDFSGYPDCRPEFLAAFETTLNVGTKAGAEGREFRIHAPLMDKTKAEIIEWGLRLGVDYGKTMSCYEPNYSGGTILACGTCDACQLRLEGFRDANEEDPIQYLPDLNLLGQ